MAEKLGLPVAAFYRIEKGLTELTLSRANTIANVFGISLAALFNKGNEVNLVTARTIAASRSKLKLREEEVQTMRKKLIEMYGLVKDMA